MSLYEDGIQNHSEVFNTMLQLIPTGYYVMKDEDFMQSTKYFQNKKKKTPKEVHKEKRMKAKRRKLDPAVNGEVDSNDNQDGILSDSEENAMYEKPSLAINTATVKSIPLDELKLKLREKIEAMRAGRNSNGQGTSKKHRKKDVAQKGKKPRMSQATATIPSANIADDCVEQLQFNRLKFDSKKNKSKKKHGKKELEFMLEKANDRQKKMEEMTQVDSKKAAEMLENDKWKKAITKAIGIKKKDDPVLLQKSIKKLDKQKKRSSKEWKKRKEAQDQVKVKKQAKREKNIKERIEKKKKQNIVKRKSGSKGTKRKMIIK